MAQRQQRFNNAAAVVCLLAASAVLGEPARTALFAQSPAVKWVATWTAAPQLVEESNLPPAPGFGDATLRQKLRVSIGGQKVRLRFSNAFGESALTLVAVHVARSAGGSAIQKSSGRPVTFRGAASVVIPAGALMVSDAFDFDLPPL